MEPQTKPMCMHIGTDKAFTITPPIVGEEIEALPKPLEPKEDAEDGEVHIYRYANQFKEASGIASICSSLRSQRYKPGDILILLRSDMYIRYSSVVAGQLSKIVHVAVQEQETPQDGEQGRGLWSRCWRTKTVFPSDLS